MLKGGFVRVDIFYGKMAPRRRALVDLVGTVVFLAPFMYVLWTAFFPFVYRAWTVDEGSPNSGGLPNWWLLQGALLAMVILVALQGAALAARSLLVLRGREEFAVTSSH
jgi:TRAP-type mannitol/chloroaromatic compound transport system permease small subunit